MFVRARLSGYQNMRGLIFVCVLFSEFIVRLPTNTHLGTLIQISHHTHTPPCRYTSTPALSLFGMPPFTANLPSRLVMPLSPSPTNYVPARPPLPPPPSPSHSQQAQRSSTLAPVYWLAGGFGGLIGFTVFRAVLYLTCSPHPDPLPHTDSSRKINTSLVFLRAGGNSWTLKQMVYKLAEHSRAARHACLNVPIQPHQALKSNV